MTDIVPATVEVWADRIRPHMVKAVEGVIDTGSALTEAKAELPHGQFGPLLDKLGISPDMAQRFMRVAKHPVLANAALVQGLPVSVSVLAELTRVSDDELTEAIDRGDITPATTRREAADLAARHQQDDDQPPAERTDDEPVDEAPVDHHETTPKPRRSSLPDSARRAGWDLRKAIERVERIVDDDRFTANKDQVATHLSGHLVYAIEACQSLSDQLSTQGE